MADIRKILIFIVVAVLFAFFVNALIEAMYSSPKYEDFCKNNMISVPQKFPVVSVNCSSVVVPTDISNNCSNAGGNVEFNYDSNGCATSYFCNMCQKQYNDADKKHNMFVFLISAVLGLIAIAAGLYLPVTKDTLTEWIASGFMLGGLITLFVGTIRYYPGMERYVRPIVLLLEIVLVIYIAYKKLNDLKK